MKIRQSFVANSSSSSFIIAVKDIETSNLPKWAERLILKTLSMITRDGTKFKSKEEVDKHFLDIYCEDTIEDLLEDTYLKNEYEKYISAIEAGYNVFNVIVDNYDEAFSEILNSLSSEDDGSEIYLISSGN